MIINCRLRVHRHFVGAVVIDIRFWSEHQHLVHETHTFLSTYY